MKPPPSIFTVSFIFLPVAVPNTRLSGCLTTFLIFTNTIWSYSLPGMVPRNSAVTLSNPAPNRVPSIRLYVLPGTWYNLEGASYQKAFCVCSFTLNRSFYRPTSSTTSVRADSSISVAVRRRDMYLCKFCGHKTFCCECGCY